MKETFGFHTFTYFGKYFTFSETHLDDTGIGKKKERV